MASRFATLLNSSSSRSRKGRPGQSSDLSDIIKGVFATAFTWRAKFGDIGTHVLADEWKVPPGCRRGLGGFRQHDTTDTPNGGGFGIGGGARDWALVRVRSVVFGRSDYVSDDFVAEEEGGASA
ncbi:hypothetical protein ACSQ67_003218 [Phaseolus vulgaris]